jgi:predicted DNA-binding transcriptional regulator AlpA
MTQASQINPNPEVQPPDKFPTAGLVRLKDIIAPDGPLPISKSSWWAGVRSGRYPPAIKLGPRTTCWCARSVRALFDPDYQK